jgi:hypothetical protein
MRSVVAPVHRTFAEMAGTSLAELIGQRGT